VRDEEGGIGLPRVQLPLLVVLLADGDEVGLALDDDERRAPLPLVLGGAPDDEVRAGLRGPAAGGVLLLRDLVEREAVLVDEHGEVLLAHPLFGRLYQPELAHVAVELPVLAGYL
jgi:hypothetical protein